MTEDYLYCPCPAEDCKGSRTPSFWYHAGGCGGKTMIKCSSCNHRAILFDWRFKCQAHDYKPASKQGALYALSIMGLHNGNSACIKEATKEIIRLWPD